jgi:hypothetical protein
MATQYANDKIVTDGLVLVLDAADRNSYVSGSTTWRDLSGNGNNGTLTNGPAFSSDSSGGIVFDGVDDYISIADTLSLNIIGNKTVEMAVKMLSVPVNTNPRLFFKYTDANNQIQIFAPGANSTRFGARIIGGGVNYDNQMSVVPTVNQIYIISVVFVSGVGIVFYLNGNLVANASGISTTFIDSTSDLSLGRWGSSNPSYSNCNIYSTRYYNRALLAPEILQNYNAQKSRFGL